MERGVQGGGWPSEAVWAVMEPFCSDFILHLQIYTHLHIYKLR